MRRSVLVLAVLGTALAACAPAATTAPSELTPPSEAAASTSASTGSVANVLPSVTGPPQPLEAGTYLTPEGFEPAVAVTVPDGWYGAAYDTGFNVGRGIDEVNERYADVGIYVEVIPAAYDDAVAGFEDLAGLVREGEAVHTELDGREATTFDVHAQADSVALDEIAPGLDVIAETGQVTFIDVDGTTLLLRTEVFDDGVEPALQDVISSLTFP